LYGLKTSTARFHEHLSKSPLRLGFKKTKHDPDLWMADKLSYYKYFATYLDDILIWVKDSMAVISLSEMFYMQKMKSTRLLFSWKCRIPCRSIEESRISISSFCKDLHSKILSEV
jgi:hypothetical protein